MAADVATLGIKVDASGAITQLGAVEGAVGSLKAAFISMAGILGLGLGLREIVTASVDAQRSFAQLEAGVRSTGMSAGFTATQLHEQAMAMQELTSFSHDAIEKTQSIFLLFQDLKGVQFQQATQAAADLAARMGTDVPDAARQLGKALEAPATGLLMLRRAGIVFTDQQTEQIKTMAKAGDLLGAQTIILDLLTQKVGGSAAALRGTLGGALSNLKNQLVDFIEVSKDGSSGTIAFINTIADGVKHLDDYKASIMGIAAALAMPAIASGVTALVASMTGLNIVAQLSMAFFMTGIPGAFAAAGVAGTGLTGVMIGLSGAMMPLMVTLGVFAVLLGTSVYIIEKQTKANDDLIDAEDRLSAAKSKDFQDSNAHIQSMIGEALTTQRLAAEVKAHTKAVDDDLQKSLDKLAETQKTIAFETTHVDLLTKIAKAEGFLTEIRDEAKKSIDAYNDSMAVQLKLSELLQSGISTTPLGATGNASIPIQTGMSGNFAQQSDAIITAGVTKRANVAHAAANALDAAFRDQQYAAWTKYYDGLAKEEEQRQKKMLNMIQGDFGNFFDTILTGGADSFGKLWNEVKAGFLKMVSDLLASDVMQQLAQSFPSTFGKNAATSGLPNGIGAPSGMSSSVATAIPVVGSMIGAIVSQIVDANADWAAARAAFTAERLAFAADLKAFVTNVAQSTNNLGQSLAAQAVSAAALANKDIALYMPWMTPLLADMSNFAQEMAAAQKLLAGSNSTQRPIVQVLIDDLNAVNDAYIANAAALKKTETDSLAVRTLRNQGNTVGADLLAKQQADAIEMQNALANNMDAAYIASLKWNQSIEETAIAMGTASTAALNMVSGYKLQATIFGAMAAHGGGTSGPYTPPTSQPYTPSSPTGATGTSGGDLTVNVVMPDGTVLGKAVLKSFKAIAQRQSGDSSKWSLIQ